MDQVDKAQQDEIDRLREHARSNRTTDRAQWAVIAALGLGLTLYLGMLMASVVKSQAEALKAMAQSCGDSNGESR